MPNGYFIGGEFKCGDVNGNEGGSLSFNRLEGGKEAFEIRERKYLEGWQIKG